MMVYFVISNAEFNCPQFTFPVTVKIARNIGKMKASIGKTEINVNTYTFNGGRGDLEFIGCISVPQTCA
ncbi:MAG TPA: hypothetical protein DER01_08340 [Phycisphaerales bacterium]|nr:hypothetical protein [Phycisphaerales bacterium]